MGLFNQKLVIWDFDGPIADSFPLQYKWFKLITTRDNRPFPFDSLESFRAGYNPHFPSFYEELGYSKKEYNTKLRTEFHEFMDGEELPIVHGVIDQIRELQARGYRQSIASNNVFKRISPFLIRHDMESLFSSLVTHESNMPRSLLKPHPNCLLETLLLMNTKVENAVYICDLSVDILAAKRVEQTHGAPMKSILVGWGYLPIDHAIHEKPTRIATTVHGLVDVVDSVFV